MVRDKISRDREKASRSGKRVNRIYDRGVDILTLNIIKNGYKSQLWRVNFAEGSESLLEHHISYYNKYGLYQVEITVSVCKDCHYKIHKQDGFFDKLNPVEGGNNPHSHENFLLTLFDSSDDRSFDYFVNHESNEEEKFIAIKDGDSWKLKKEN